MFSTKLERWDEWGLDDILSDGGGDRGPGLTLELVDGIFEWFFSLLFAGGSSVARPAMGAVTREEEAGNASNEDVGEVCLGATIDEVEAEGEDKLAGAQARSWVE
jgi:hypothetical protein